MNPTEQTYQRGWDRALAKVGADLAAEQAAARRLEAAAERGAALQVAATAPGGLLSVPDVAALLALSEDFVRAHAAELGGSRVGSRLRFRRSSIDAWIDSRQLIEPSDAPERRPGPHRAPAGVELLPLPDRRDE